jgi:hypothetical protein
MYPPVDFADENQEALSIIIIKVSGFAIIDMG